jgi:hypothetical protein
VTESDDSTCGTVVAKAAPLIVFGESTISGQFPWHAAIYISTVSFELKIVAFGLSITFINRSNNLNTSAAER